jgi:8-oxo-dGTP diphosphatase
MPDPVSTDSPEGYRPEAFARPSVAVDVVAFTAHAGRLEVLLIERGVWPEQGSWALPGGFVRMDESLDDAARRELAEETGVEGAAYLEQLYTFGAVSRDPRTRVISVTYYALLPEPNLAPRAGTDAAAAQWWPVSELPPLAFDHEEIVQTALARLRAKLGYTSVAVALLAPEFTLTELQTTYEIILSRPLDKRNFRKKLLATGLLEGLEKQRRDGAHRPAQLFQFTQKEPVFLP